MNYFSQYNQDKFIDTLFKNKTGGVFVDIGAHDGITLSNTYFLEKYRDWKGICIEPNPIVFNKLKESRSTIAVNTCIGNREGTVGFLQIEGYSEMLSGIVDKYDTQHMERIQAELQKHGGQMQEIDVPVQRLKDILAANNINRVDYCSIDAEGAELEILESIDFEAAEIEVFTIENNYKDKSIKNFLKDKKYKLIKKLKGDDVFQLAKYRKSWFF